MAEHTSSSITIEAAPADVMRVIADFARYPDWTGEVKEAEVLAADAKGRAEQVRLVMDAGAIKDDQTLAYTWTGDHEVSWTLVKSQMLRTLDGAYDSRPGGCSQRLDRCPRLDRMLDMADRMGMTGRAQAGDLVERKIRAGGDDEIVISQRGVVVELDPVLVRMDAPGGLC